MVVVVVVVAVVVVVVFLCQSTPSVQHRRSHNRIITHPAHNDDVFTIESQCTEKQ